MTNFLTFAMMSGAGAGAEGGAQSGSFSMIIMMAVLFGAMYFFTIRPQKKQQKMEQELRENTQIGDEITTIGGIMGRVVTVKEDSLIIETGADRTKMKITRWAIQTNNTAEDRLQAERAAQAAAKEAEKAEKAKGKRSKKNSEEE